MKGKGLLFSALFLLVIFGLGGGLHWHLQANANTLGALVQVLAADGNPVFSVTEFWQGVGLVSVIILMLVALLYASWTLIGYYHLKLFLKKLSKKRFALFNAYWLLLFLVYSFFYFLIRLKFSAIDKVIRGNSTGVVVIDVLDIIIIGAFFFFVTLSYKSNLTIFFVKPGHSDLMTFVVFVFSVLVIDAIVSMIGSVSQIFGFALSFVAVILLWHWYWKVMLNKKGLRVLQGGNLWD